MLELMGARLEMRECTADELPALLAAYISNPDFVEQNEGSEGGLAAMTSIAGCATGKLCK